MLLEKTNKLMLETMQRTMEAMILQNQQTQLQFMQQQEQLLRGMQSLPQMNTTDLGVSQLALATATAAGKVADSPAKQEELARREKEEKEVIIAKIDEEDKKEVEKLIKKIKIREEKKRNLQAKIKKEAKIIEEMGEDKFPTGVRPYKYPEELEALREKWPDSIRADTSVVIAIKAGSTVAEMLTKVYHTTQKLNRSELQKAWQKKLDIDMQQLTEGRVLEEITNSVRSAAIEGGRRQENAEETLIQVRKMSEFIKDKYQKALQELD